MWVIHAFLPSHIICKHPHWHQFVNVYICTNRFWKSIWSRGTTQKVDHFETLLFYMNDSNKCNESIYLPCWLLSTQYSATEERKEMFYKDTNFAIGLHSEHSRQSLLFFFSFFLKIMLTLIYQYLQLQ
jgi:hypothetical protein